MASELVTYESQIPRDNPLTKPIFKVVLRVVDKMGNSVRKGAAVQNLTEAKALDFIKAEQRKFERSGHNKEFDYFWGANSASPGCASEYVTRWTIERV
jgi:hypothetical protein